MRYLGMVVCMVAALTACTTTNLREQTRGITAGMSQQAVEALLGLPGDRSFRGRAEAWQYCQTGVQTDSYATIWFVDGVVVALTTLNAALIPMGLCSAAFPEVDWGQVPPDVTIAIEVR